MSSQDGLRVAFDMNGWEADASSSVFAMGCATLVAIMVLSAVIVVVTTVWGQR